jgi:hypothetical protein
LPSEGNAADFSKGSYPRSYFHIYIGAVRTEEGKLHLLLAVDQTSKYAFA